jgi:hypothetical protein
MDELVKYLKLELPFYFKTCDEDTHDALGSWKSKAGPGAGSPMHHKLDFCPTCSHLTGSEFFIFFATEWKIMHLLWLLPLLLLEFCAGDRLHFVVFIW